MNVASIASIRIVPPEYQRYEESYGDSYAYGHGDLTAFPNR
jgi:hypothetical protein